jgi:hypothetical protein
MGFRALAGYELEGNVARGSSPIFDDRQGLAIGRQCISRRPDRKIHNATRWKSNDKPGLFTDAALSPRGVCKIGCRGGGHPRNDLSPIHGVPQSSVVVGIVRAKPVATATDNGPISVRRIDDVRDQESHGGTLIFCAADPGKTLGPDLVLNLSGMGSASLGSCGSVARVQ